MPAILPAVSIDSAQAESRYFTPYQLVWIADDSQLRLVKKSVRIGWTYGDAFKNVRKRLRTARRDYLFGTKDQATAFEYVDQCYKFCEIYKLTKSVLSRGIEDMKVPRFDSDGKDTGFVDEVKVGVIKFDNGSRILAFSSNPNAMRAFGGDVGLDEFAFHPRAKELWAAAQGRVTWGFDLGCWSSVNGADTLHEEFCRDAEAGKGGWSYYRITIEDAVEMGLVEKINQVSGRTMSREQFVADCKTRSRFPEVYDQDYMCVARGTANPQVGWSVLERARQDYVIERMHVEASDIEKLAGKYDRTTAGVRAKEVANVIKAAFSKLLTTPGRYSLGFDVAASGQGDLAVIYIDQEENKQLTLRGLFTARVGDDWPFLKAALYAFLDELSSVKAAGDETGLGRQICREAAMDFPGQFECVNFRSEKSDLGTYHMNQLSSGEKLIPRNQADIAQDFFTVSRVWNGSKWIFTEGRNAHNPASHADINWGSALSSHAAKSATNTFHIALIGSES